MRLHVAAAIVLLISLLAFCAARADSPAPRPAPPDAAAVRKAEASIEALYHDELAKAPDPATKLVTAKNILQAAAEEKDAATKYALYQKAIDLAVQAGDIETATRGIDGINREWDVDLSKLMAKTLIDASHRVRTPAAQTEMAHRMQTATADAMADGQYDGARELINAAIACARQGNEPTLADSLSAQAAEITRIRSAHSRIEPAVLTLKSKPADPSANWVVGRFECFVAGNWKAGLPKLAIGSDAALKALAQMELAATSATDQAAAADWWWTMSK